MKDALIIDDNRSTADALHQMLTVLDIPAARGVWGEPGDVSLERFHARFDPARYQHAGRGRS